METQSCRTGLPGWSHDLWDPRLVAPSYATFSALLAGLAIAGLFWKLQPKTGGWHQKELNLDDSEAVIAVWLSLLPLVLSTLLSAEAAGESSCVAGSFDAFDSTLVLAIGSVLLFVGVGKLLAQLGRDLRHSAVVICWAALSLASFFTYEGNDTVLVSSYKQAPNDAGGLLGVWLIVIVIVPVILRWAYEWRKKPGGLKSMTFLVVAVCVFNAVVFYWFNSSGNRELHHLRDLIFLRAIEWFLFVLAVVPAMPWYNKEPRATPVSPSG